MLRRAKSVDIPFMITGYEIGLRDGNFSKSSMQINAFFAKTISHKNVHSYIYQHDSRPAGYAILRKKDSHKHEIMMMFVDETLQGKGIGKKFLLSLLSEPMKDSPIICSTTQTASNRMMKMLSSIGFEKKAENSDGIYWEKQNTAPASVAAASGASPPSLPTGRSPILRVALPITFDGEIQPPTEPVGERQLAAPAGFKKYASPAAPPPIIEHAPPPQFENAQGDNSDLRAVAEPAEPPPSPLKEKREETGRTHTASAPEENRIELEDKIGNNLGVVEESVASIQEASPVITLDDEAATLAHSIPPASTDVLPQPPRDFSAKRPLPPLTSKREQAQLLARQLFETLRQSKPETHESPPASPDTLAPSSEVTNPASEEDIPLLATLNKVREQLGSLPSVKLPPLDRYHLMEMNKKDLENMNVVELAALSAQLIKLARDQLAEIDRLKLSAKRRR